MKVNVRVGSTANPYLSKDGLLDIKKLATLRGKVDKAIEKFKPESKKTRGGYVIQPVFAKTIKEIKSAQGLKVVIGLNPNDLKVTKHKDGYFVVTYTGPEHDVNGIVRAFARLTPTTKEHYVVGVKSKQVAYDGVKNRKGTEYTYLGRRAFRLASRTRLSEKSLPMLSVYSKQVLGDALYKHVVAAKKACETHIKNAEKYKKTITKARGVVRDEKTKEFGDAIDQLKPRLLAAGFKESELVEGQTMMGRSLFIKMGNTILSLGLSSKETLKKAMSSESGTLEDDDLEDEGLAL